MKTFKEFIQEIQIVVDQDEHQLAFYAKHITDEEPLSRMENFIVYKGKINGTHTAYVARQDDENKTFIGYSIGVVMDIDGKHYWRSKYTYFDKQFRGKGYATALYQFFLKKLAMPLISDDTQSKFGKALWKSLMKSNKYKIFDSDKGEFVDPTLVKDSELWTVDAELGKRYNIVLEEAPPLKRKFISMIFHDRQEYTGPYYQCP